MRLISVVGKGKKGREALVGYVNMGKRRRIAWAVDVKAKPKADVMLEIEQLEAQRALTMTP